MKDPFRPGITMASTARCPARATAPRPKDGLPAAVKLAMEHSVGGRTFIPELHTSLM
ncbi:hypothetical protein MASR2M17_02270 [Aminivibrio sp.]